ncbi:unnamed protein product [Ambrosiozyma monospora]|uniref:Unnamed protein product n=1 Tax=Ambrosiozyma monospora TaxID=43982 RepID=A0ACB5SZQ3_AMBMO|nr:unnamed protein product [Ambrosiozyma monospora]
MSEEHPETEKYTNMFHPEFVPGTINLLLERVDEEHVGKSHLKTTKDGIILHPQPTDNPNDPLNWGKWTKLYQFFLLAFITGFTAATSNNASAVQESMNEVYSISYDSMNTGAGVLFVSIALTTVFLGPTSYLCGRKISYIICVAMGLAGLAWFANATRTADTIWSQLFVGSSEACAEATVQLSIADMYYSHQLSWALTIYIIATSVGTYLGPLIAGFIVDADYTWVGYAGLIISCVLLLVVLFTQYETYFDRLSYSQVEGKRARLGNESPTDSTAKETIDKESTNDLEATQSNKRNTVAVLTTFTATADVVDGTVHSGWKAFFLGNSIQLEKKSYLQNISLLTPSNNLKGFGFKQYIHRLFAMLRVFWFPPVLYSGLQWGLQDAFLTFYLTTEDNDYYDPPFNYSNHAVALMNIPCVIGAVMGCCYAGVLSDKFVRYLAKRRGGVQEAEDYLWFLFALMPICPIGLVVFACGTDNNYKWPIIYIFGLGFLGFSFGCAGDIAMAYLMAAYPEMVLEGMIAVACINNFIGCIFTFACSPWLERMSNAHTYAILAALQFAALLFNVPLIMYGKKIRMWTKKYYVSYVEERDKRI